MNTHLMLFLTTAVLVSLALFVTVLRRFWNEQYRTLDRLSGSSLRLKSANDTRNLPFA